MAAPLINELEKLRIFLQEGGIERTFGLCELMGNDCQHYKKSLNLFLDKHFDKIYDQLQIVLTEYKKVKHD